MGAFLLLLHVVTYNVLASEVAQHGPLLIHSGVGLVVLQHVLRVRMVFQIAAKPSKILVMHHKIYIVIPRNETAVAQRTEHVSAVDTARHAYLLSRLLQINGHIEHPQLCLSQQRTVGIVFPAQLFFSLAGVIFHIFEF